MPARLLNDPSPSPSPLIKGEATHVHPAPSGVKTWWSMRKMAFAPGFRNYIEATGPVSGVMSIGEMIRTK